MAEQGSVKAYGLRGKGYSIPDNRIIKTTKAIHLLSATAWAGGALAMQACGGFVRGAAGPYGEPCHGTDLLRMHIHRLLQILLDRLQMADCLLRGVLGADVPGPLGRSADTVPLRLRPGRSPAARPLLYSAGEHVAGMSAAGRHFHHVPYFCLPAVVIAPARAYRRRLKAA